MSHTAAVKTVPITSISALQAAALALKAAGVNCTLEQNATPRMYYSHQIKNQMASTTKGQEQYKFAEDPDCCPYVLRLHDSCYDVGFLEMKEGGYAPVFDNHASRVSTYLGTGSGNNPEAIHKLLQNYTLAAVKEAAVAQGLNLEDSYLNDKGEAVLVYV